ncbi:hypothetical protein [Oryzihumus leptocrescens]|uniref:Hpr(Ser) kinase/phosphatase n=1 Tax=Oryzihumus leptocrescens TaxID=297536 RepID=A0A542Z9C4_9MICO|nr:hypothetical protein [Oryzihumus leptocrescens]TQL56921.1 hypothetical protein FB474_3687 [Oryzihumus leptocrescens]
MRATMVQAGEQVLLDCQPPWLSRLLAEACGDALRRDAGDTDPDVHLVVTGDRSPFAVAGWAPLTRGAVHRDRSVVMTNACGSGFDVRVDVLGADVHPKVRVEARFRPPAREQLAAWGLRSRFHLLVRAALVQYPALWVAGTRGRVPLHAAAVMVGDDVALLAGPGGVGRSTLLLRSLEDGGLACADNLCVSDGTRVHGLVEPMRVVGAGGRRMPHGRSERSLPHRVDSLTPTRLVVMRREERGRPAVSAIDPARAASVLAAGTYMAGELRRYWPFAATLALGTGTGPAHPDVTSVARTLAALPAVELTLGPPPAPSLAEMLARAAQVGS